MKVKQRQINNITLWGILWVNVSVAITGFLKDLSVVSYFGTTRLADAFNVAYYLPDTLGNNILASALGVACVPMFSRMWKAYTASVFWRQVRRVVQVALMLSIILIAILWIFRTSVVDAYVGNMRLVNLIIPLLDVMLPSILFFCMASIGSAILQAKRRFAVSAIVPLSLNLIILSTILSLRINGVSTNHGAATVAISITAGMAAATLIIWMFAIWGGRQQGGLETETVCVADSAENGMRSDAKGVWRLFAWYGLYLLSVQVVGLVERYIAARQSVGTVSALTYAYRLVQLPIWVYVAGLGAVILPSLSRYVARKQLDAVREQVLRAFQYSLTVTVPFSLLFVLMGKPLISALLQHGAFGAQSVEKTAVILSTYAWVIPAQAVVAICFRFFLAADRMMLPVLISVAATIINIVADFIFTRMFGAPGLGIGASIGAISSAVVMFVVVARALGIRADMLSGFVIKTLAANVILAIIFSLSGTIWSRFAVNITFVSSLVFMAVVFLIGLPIYLFLLRYWHVFKNLI